MNMASRAERSKTIRLVNSSDSQERNRILMDVYAFVSERQNYKPRAEDVKTAFEVCKENGFYIMALVIARRLDPDRVPEIHLEEIEKREREGWLVSAGRIAEIALKNNELADSLYTLYLNRELKNKADQHVRKGEAAAFATDIGKHEKAADILASREPVTK